MLIIIFQCITTGKTEVSEECFIQNNNTNFLSNTYIFSRKSCCSKNYGNHGICRQAGRDVKCCQRQLCFVSKLTVTKIQVLGLNV
jgi:hypothetical protein